VNRRKLDRVRLMREHMLLAIAVDGVRALFEHKRIVEFILRRDPPGIVMLRHALHDSGLRWREIDDVLDGGAHHRACACWRCVLRLQYEVMVSAAVRNPIFDVLENDVPDTGDNDNEHFGTNR
jgi:hypothetical protein